jgi:prepilin-type N-terminal cleavage/methylation domain-containing protein
MTKRLSQLIGFQSGFTLIELLVVTTIIIVLSTIGLVSFQRATQNSRNAKRRADMETVRQALVLYRTDNGAYPLTNAFSWTTMAPIQDYISATSYADPQNDAPYTYAYTSNGTTFEVCAYLEPDPGEEYCLTNP